MQDQWSTLTRAVSQAIGDHDRAAHVVDGAEQRLRQVEVDLEATAEMLRKAVADLHAAFPELTPGHV